jgi:O-antigen ligase
MSAKTYINILKYGALASMLTIFLVFKNLLFPFITSKQITYNIIIEILLIFWVALIVKYPEYRPKKSLISYGLLTYFVVIIISCFTGVDFNLSFWGDIERMLGVFPLLHFLALYFIIITVFRSWKDWKLLFIYSAVLAVLVSLYGIANNEPYSTFGNTEYVAAYFIFSIYFCLLLPTKEKNKKLGWLYFLPLPLFIWSFKAASISGAYVGFGFSILVALFLYTLLAGSKKVKICFGLVFLLTILAGAIVLANQNSDFVRNSSLLNPFADINLNSRTLNTRFISWITAAKDFKNHPLLGNGYGNFAMTFDKYFDPKFYNYTRAETYFDKAHNNIVEVASTTGILGLLSYLSIFAAVAYYFVLGYRNKRIGLHDFILISSLLSAYFVQNLAVFDALETYIVFMIALAYVYWLYHYDEDQAKQDEKNANINDGFSDKEVYALVISGFLLLIIMYQYNIKVYEMLDQTIAGQIAYSQGQVEQTVDIYKQALSLNTVLDRDSRTSLINLFVSNPAVLNNIPSEKRQADLDFLIANAEANVKYNEHDSMMQMILAQVYNVAAMYYAPTENNQGDLQKFSEYSDKSLKAIDASIEASPRRIPIYFQKAQILMTRGEKDKVIETLQYATTLNPDYSDSFCYLGRALLMFGQEDEGYKNISRCLDLPGAGDSLNSPVLVKQYLQHFQTIKDWQRTISLYEILVYQEKNNAGNWVQLAVLYKQQGDKEKAKAAAEKAIEIDPNFQAQAQSFIDSLK